MKKKLALFLAVASLGTATSAMAAVAINSQGNNFPTGTTLTEAYKVSYEVYNNTAGATTIASKGELNIKLSQPLTVGQNVNIVISNGNALFNSAGTGQRRYGLCSVVLPTDDCAAGGIVASMPPSGVTTANLGMQVTKDVAAGAAVYVKLVQWNDNNGPAALPADVEINNNEIDANEVASVIQGPSLFINPGLGANCNLHPLVQMTFSSAGGESTAVPFNYAYITPQFTFVGPTATSFNAELDTDNDFLTFIANSGPNVAPGFTDYIYDTSFFTIADTATGILSAPYWISAASVSPQGTVSFKIRSAAVEPTITDMWLDWTTLGNDNCVADSSGKLWTCSDTGVDLVGTHEFEVILGGTENNPTNWTITDFAVSVTTAGFNSLCFASPGPGIGSWYGGIEAIVPFVKSNDTYKTFVKLYNRYVKEAKIYVSNMNQNKDSIVTSILQLEGVSQYPNSAGVNLNAAIPAGGYVTITGLDLFTGGVLSATELDQGAPIKFLIRVPAQAGSFNAGMADLQVVDGDASGSGEVYDSGFGAADYITGSAAGVGTLSVVDPYINGIVVQTYNSGTAQRSIPLVFKGFKQGQYN